MWRGAGACYTWQSTWPPLLRIFRRHCLVCRSHRTTIRLKNMDLLQRNMFPTLNPVTLFQIVLDISRRRPAHAH